MAKQWKRYANGCGYCAVRVEDGVLLPWTFSAMRKAVKDNLAYWLGKEHYAANAHRFRIVRCIVSEAPRDA